jgi:predicted nucleotidyltransferase
MPGLPPQQQQQVQGQPQAQQLLELLKQAGGAGNPNLAHILEQQQFIQQSGSAVGAQQQQQQQASMEQLLQILNNQRDQQQQQQQQQRDIPSPRSLYPRPVDGEIKPTTTALRVPAFRDHHQRGHGWGGDHANTSHRPSPAPGREGRWVDVMDRSHDGRSPRCDMNQLNTSLLSLAETLMPTAEERGRWESAFETVKKILLAKWPEGRVILFGSAANGLSVRSSNDIDVSLQIAAVGDDAAGKSEIIEKAGIVLEDAGMNEILCLPKARVPVVKFTVPSTDTKVDITVNNTLACVNTKLLADYCKVDPRLAQLVAVVKHWAKKRAVNDPYRGTLSSYCYVLMCIYHLQSRSPPVLPVLQALPPTISVQVREWRAEFFDDVEALKGFGNENTQNLGELVWQFFEYWAWRHDYMSGVISIRTGSVLPKDEKDWTRRIGNERHLLCVEDPFELSHDLGRTVDRQTRDVMRKEFLRAATLLRDAEDPLEQVFEGFKKR